LMQIDKPFVFLQISVVAIVPNMALWAVMADSKSLQAIMGAGGLDQWSISAAGLEQGSSLSSLVAHGLMHAAPRDQGNAASPSTSNCQETFPSKQVASCRCESSHDNILCSSVVFSCFRH